MFGRQRALLAVLAQEGVVYFTIFTPEFNHNVVLLPLWAWLGLAGVSRLLRRGAARGIGRWAWFGVLAALGMLGKYTTALFLLPAVAARGAASRIRRGWASPGPWLALAVGALVLLPHLLGLWRIDFAPLLFPFERAPGPIALVRPHRQPAAVRRGAVRRYRGGVARARAAGVAAIRGERLATDGPSPLPPDQRA